MTQSRTFPNTPIANKLQKLGFTFEFTEGASYRDEKHDVYRSKNLRFMLFYGHKKDDNGRNLYITDAKCGTIGSEQQPDISGHCILRVGVDTQEQITKALKFVGLTKDVISKF